MIKYLYCTLQILNLTLLLVLILFFFFQAEDGIRDGHVTGVQTCALPIYQESEISLKSPKPVVASKISVRPGYSQTSRAGELGGSRRSTLNGGPYRIYVCP